MNFKDFKHIQAGTRIEIVETRYFQIWVNFGGMTVKHIKQIFSSMNIGIKHGGVETRA